MMFFVLIVGTLFFLMGYYLRLLLGPLFCPGERLLSHSRGSTNKGIATNDQDPLQMQKTSYFNPIYVTIGPKTSDAIEDIFDILLDQYVLSWYKTLSNDPDFIIQVKLYLQYLSASLIHRLKSFEITGDTLDCITRAVLGHFERIFSSLPADNWMESMLEDSVLRAFGSHLHICMASRSSELSYVRALVNRILPHISYPPGLVSPSATSVEKFLKPESWKHAFSNLKRPASQNSARAASICLVQVPRSSSIHNLPIRHSQHVSLGTNRAAYSFLVEILSTCVLLPAIDAIANPDLINKLILFSSGPTGDSVSPLMETSPEVPVLNTYVQEWRKWISEKPPVSLHLERLLHHEDFHPFLQYMKSIKATVPLITVFLLSNINRRVLRDPLPPDICREIRSQIHHLLSLVRDSVNRESVHAQFQEDEETMDWQPEGDGQNPRLFDLSSEFEALLTNFLAEPTDADSLDKLVHTQIWRKAYQSASQQMSLQFLPMYLESPEYMTHKFGASAFGPAERPSTPNASSHGSQTDPKRFENPLKSMFTGNTVEGRVLYNIDPDSNRPAMRLANRPTKPLSQGLNNRPEAPLMQSQWMSGDGHHQLHSHYMFHSRHIDLSNWRVYIPGLSRPEIQPGKSLIDQLTQSSNARNTSPNRRAQYSARPHDASFRAKITDELQNLQTSSGSNRMPQLSAQFLFTVRSERVVRGVRQPIARVDRKYSEFYVLEQKLIEFHGNAITQSLPPRKFAPRTFEFLESKRELFEEYLQYLIAQPFLRNSELLHGFLTSKIPFTSSLLFELNLGRFVKSVPLKLIKERGQYLDQFLMSFYVSCNPQPILMEPVESSLEPVFTIFPSSGVGTLGGIDALASPDHYSLKKSSSDGTTAFKTTDPSCGGSSMSNTSRLSNTRHYSLDNSSSLTKRRHHRRTWLDNRLRVKMFWNNAGFSLERRQDLHNKPCDFLGAQPSGFTELAIYAFTPLALNPGDSLDVSAESCMNEDGGKTCNQANDTITEPAKDQVIPVEPWDIGNSGWNEALLCAPIVTPATPIATHAFETLTPDSPTALQDSEEQAEPPVLKNTVTDRQGRTVSISLNDMVVAFTSLWRLVSQHLLTHLRFLLLWILYLLRGYFKTWIDPWFISQIKRYLQNTLTDNTIATALQTLKTTLFYTTTQTTDSERLERKIAAQAALQKTLMSTSLTSILDSQLLKERVDKLFTCLQHPKWNKQLTYVLLDQLVLALFPELTDQANEQLPIS